MPAIAPAFPARPGTRLPVIARTPPSVNFSGATLALATRAPACRTLCLPVIALPAPRPSTRRRASGNALPCGTLARRSGSGRPSRRSRTRRPLSPGVVVAAPPARQLCRDRSRHRALQELDAVVAFGSRRARRFYGGHGDAVDAGLGLRPYDVTSLGPLVKKRGVKRATRFEGAGRTPGPSAVRPRARQLDLQATGHRTTLQLRRCRANSVLAKPERPRALNPYDRLQNPLHLHEPRLVSAQ